eukprot:scaffold830_cov112-Isochrysis_galbana.AAC.7
MDGALVCRQRLFTAGGLTGGPPAVATSCLGGPPPPRVRSSFYVRLVLASSALDMARREWCDGASAKLSSANSSSWPSMRAVGGSARDLAMP